MGIDDLRQQPRSRPKGRRDQLATVAAELFRRHGYHRVGVNHIAEAAGITGPAVYRHFGSKQEILGHVVLTGIDQLSAAVHEVVDSADTAEATDADRLDVLLRAVARLVVERRELGALWRRERRALPAGDHAEAVRRLAVATRFGADRLRRVRPELTEADADLLCSAALSVYGSISEHHVSLPKDPFERLLHDLASAAAHCRLAPPSRQFASESHDGSDPNRQFASELPGRREQLRWLAARAFCERGYHAVTMEDIGAAAGIAGPSIYRHYESKADLLLAMCQRIGRQLRAGMELATAAESTPAAALDALTASFVRTVLANRDLVAAFLTEGHNLPPKAWAEVRRFQRDYVAAWVRIVLDAQPGRIEEKSAAVRVHASFAIVNDLARTGRFADRPGLAADLTAIATAVLRA